MNKNLKLETSNNFFWQLIGTVGQTFIQFLLLMILARLLTADDFGIAQSALVIIGLANLISQMGVGPALVQKQSINLHIIKTAFTISILLGLFLGCLLFFLSPFFALFFKAPLLKNILELCSIIFIFESLTVISQSLLQREMKLKTLAKVDFISYTVGYGLVTIVLAYLEYGVWSLIWGAVIQSVIKTILYYLEKPFKISFYISRIALKELLYFGGGFTLARFFNYMANQGDNIIVARFLGTEPLGFYSRAYTIMVKPVSLIGNIIDKVLFPVMSVSQKDNKKLLTVFINGSKIILYLSIPVSVMIYFSSFEIIYLLLGNGWDKVVFPLQILSIGIFCRLGYKMGDILTKSTGYVYSRAKRNFFYALSIFLGCYVGSFWGINGVAFGTLFAIILNYILMIDLSIKILNINWLLFIKEILKETPAVLIISVIFFFIYGVLKIYITSYLLLILLSYGLYILIIILGLYFFGRKLSFVNYIPYSELLIKKNKK